MNLPIISTHLACDYEGLQLMVVVCIIISKNTVMSFQRRFCDWSYIKFATFKLFLPILKYNIADIACGAII